MSLINYKDIDFKKSINNDNIMINFNGSEIRIVNYLPTHEKYDLIMITLQKSFENNIYNEYKLKMYFDLHLIYMYTNIIFDAEDRADEEGLYDILKRSGLIDLVKDSIPEDTFELWTILHTIAAEDIKYRTSVAGFISDFIDDLGEKVEKGLDLLKGFNMQEFLKNNPALEQVINKPEILNN